MYIIEAISKLDHLKHNTYSYSDKVRWLSSLDSRVMKEVISTHELPGPVHFVGYDETTNVHDILLLIPEPYDEVYIRWMEAQIDYSNGEYGKYNNSIEMFNALWRDYVNWYNRNYMPKGKTLKFF